jgi:hypothetical protein
LVEVCSFDGFSLYALEEDVKHITTKNKIDMFDFEGYKYFFNKSNVNNVKKKKNDSGKIFSWKPIY